MDSIASGVASTMVPVKLIPQRMMELTCFFLKDGDDYYNLALTPDDVFDRFVNQHIDVEYEDESRVWSPDQRVAVLQFMGGCGITPQLFKKGDVHV